jgi:hypothetical protein
MRESTDRMVIVERGNSTPSSSLREHGSKDPHAKHVALPLAPVGGLCHRIRPPVPDAAKATVIPAKAGIQASLILDPGLRRGDGVSDNSLPRLQEIHRHSLWTLTTCTARGFPERTESPDNV